MAYSTAHLSLFTPKLHPLSATLGLGTAQVLRSGDV